MWAQYRKRRRETRTEKWILLTTQYKIIWNKQTAETPTCQHAKQRKNESWPEKNSRRLTDPKAELNILKLDRLLKDVGKIRNWMIHEIEIRRRPMRQTRMLQPGTSFLAPLVLKVRIGRTLLGADARRLRGLPSTSQKFEELEFPELKHS